MEQDPNRSSDLSTMSGPAPAGGRVVYLLTSEEGVSGRDDEFRLADLVRIGWEHKWLMGLITLIFLAAAGVYLILATPWYRSEVLLIPAAERSTQGLSGKLGGLAGLAGISVDDGGSVEALAVLNSRDFTRAFIEDEKLLPVLLANKQSASIARWLPVASDDSQDIRDAVLYFNDSVRAVRENINTKLVTLTVTWTDPEIAADWANTLVRRLNQQMRRRALAEAEVNAEYLRSELSRTSVVTLQQSIGRLLESELQKLMLARGDEEFAFRVIDHAEPAKEPSAPRATLILLLAFMLGFIVSIAAAVFRHANTFQATSVRTHQEVSGERPR